MPNILRRIVDFVFNNPGLFFRFRRLIHNDFTCEKEVILRESDPNNTKYVLDFGCGVGQYSTLFMSQSYIGVDVERKYIDYAKRNFAGEFLLISEEEPLALQKDILDLILAVDLFHHLSSKESHAVLKEFKRVLKDSGKIIIDLSPSEFQPNLLGKLLIMLDRGRFVRDKEEFVSLFSEHFNTAKHYTIKSGPYNRQVFVLARRP